MKTKLHDQTLIGQPPGKVISPPLLSSTPYSGLPNNIVGFLIGGFAFSKLSPSHQNCNTMCITIHTVGFLIGEFDSQSCLCLINTVCHYFFWGWKLLLLPSSIGFVGYFNKSTGFVGYQAPGWLILPSIPDSAAKSAAVRAFLIATSAHPT